jgi:hypothetical protein
MKIDKLVELFNTDQIAIITNKETINSFFDDIDTINGGYAYFGEPTHFGAIGIFRKGVEVFFIDKEGLEDIKFKKI